MKKTIKMALSTAVLLMAFAASALAEDDPWKGELWITCQKCWNTGLYLFTDKIEHAEVGADSYSGIRQWYSLGCGDYSYCYLRPIAITVRKTYVSVPTCTQAGFLFLHCRFCDYEWYPQEYYADGPDISGAMPVDALGHDYGADGLCTRCGGRAPLRYIAADGSEGKRYDGEYTVLTGGDAKTLTGGWYAVTENVTYTGTLTLSGDATIILADGKTLNIGTEDGRIGSGNCITGGDYSLTIYGQSAQTGTLNAYNSTSGSGSSAVYVKNYTQHGGNVTIDATGEQALWLNYGNLALTRGTLTANVSGGNNSSAIYTYGATFTVNVSGGTLNATSTNGFGINNKLTMSGGTVKASGHQGAIVSATTVSGGTLNATGHIRDEVALSGGTTTIDGNIMYGSLALSGTATATVTGTVMYDVTIAPGHIFTDGTNYYSGTLTADEKSAISGKTLRPFSLSFTPTSATVFGETKYVTTFFNSSTAFLLPEGAAAYTAGLDGDQVVFYRIGEDSDVIPAGTAVVIIADASALSEGKLNMTVLASTDVTARPGSILRGSDTAIAKPSGTVYVLGVDGSGAMTFKTFTGSEIPGGKAYYLVTE